MAQKLLGLLFFTLAAGSLSAANVSFLVIESNLPGEDTANQYTVLWENSLMEVFFESGHIVTNSPILRANIKPGSTLPGEAERDFEMAGEGGMQYFLITVIEYPASARTTTGIRPSNVSMRLFKTGSRTMIWEQSFTSGKSKTVKEEEEYIKKAIGDMAVQIK